jgi:hypothetical protein
MNNRYSGVERGITYLTPLGGRKWEVGSRKYYFRIPTSYFRIPNFPSRHYPGRFLVSKSEVGSGKSEVCSH